MKVGSSVVATVLAWCATTQLARAGSDSGDSTASVRTALEALYARAVQAYADDAPGAVLALRAPDFSAVLPNGPRWTADESAAYVRASFAQVDSTLQLSFVIDSLAVQGDTAIATIHQTWKRLQQKAGRQRLVETEAVQREWWRHTADGWRLFRVDAVRPGIWKVDGKRVDPSRPYDPKAPPFEPSRHGS